MKRILSFLLVFIFLSAQSQVVLNMKKVGGVYEVPCKVNGLNLSFIFDTGASDVSISLIEALFMIRHGYLKEENILGAVSFSIANGDIAEGTKILLKEVEIGGLKLYNVKASIVHEMSAPLLLGQSAIQKLGRITIDGDKIIIIDRNKDLIDTNNHSSIVIGSFGAMSNAERQKQTLIREGFDNVDISKVGNVYRVSVLVSGSKEKVQEVHKRVKVYHKSAWINDNSTFKIPEGFELVEENYINSKDITGNFNKGFTYDSNGMPVSGLVKNFSESSGNQEYTLKDGKPHGLRKEWHKGNSQLQLSWNYLNGKKHGRCISYYKNGRVQAKENYINGFTIGKLARYYENGQVWFSTTVEGDNCYCKDKYRDGFENCLECIKNKIILYHDDGTIQKIYTPNGQNVSIKFYKYAETFEDEMSYKVIYRTLNYVSEVVTNIKSNQYISNFIYSPISKYTRPKEEKKYLLREEDHYKTYQGENITFKHISYDKDGFKIYQENFDIDNKKSTLIIYHDNGKKSYLLEVKYLYPELKLIEIGKRNNIGDEMFLSDAYPRYELIEQKCFNQQETPIKCSDN